MSNDKNASTIQNNWLVVHKTINGAGNVVVERNPYLNKVRFTLIENHGLHIEIKEYDGDYSGPVDYPLTWEFIDQMAKAH